MNRREFLAAATGLSSVVVAAGCTSPSSSTTPTSEQSTTRTTTESSTTTTPSTPVVDDVWVDRSFRYLYAGAHYNAYTVTGAGPVFVFALAEDGAQPTLDVDGESHDPADKLAGTYADNVFHGRETDERSVVAYSLPGPVEASSAAVGDVELTDAQRAFLADPAEFAVTDVSVPESVQQDGEATVTITAANGGGTTGTFRAAATSESLSAFDVRHVDVDPGQRASVEIRVPIGSENEERVNYTWGSDGGDRTVRVET